MTATPPRKAIQITEPDASLGNWMAWFKAPDGTQRPLEVGRMKPDPIIVKDDA